MPDTVAGVPVYRDSAGVLREQTAQTQITDLGAQMAGKADVTALTAVANAVPKPASIAPMAEKTGAAIGGATTRYALEDHQHPRLTSTTYATLGANGTAVVTFTRSFTNPPGVVLTEVDSAGSQPLVCVVQSWMRETMTPTPAGAYIGCVIKGYRSQVLPAQSQLSLATLLTGLITGVNALAASLTGYNLFGASAAGATISTIAVARSDVAAT